MGFAGLEVTRCALTGLVVVQNWASRTMMDFAAGTVIGLVAGVFFDLFGAVALGLTGGIFGAVGGYSSTKRAAKSRCPTRNAQPYRIQLQKGQSRASRTFRNCTVRTPDFLESARLPY